MDQQKIFEKFAAATLKSVQNINDWKKALLHIERQEKSVGFKSSYINSLDEEIKIDTEVDYYTSKAVQELYKITTKHPLKHINWNKALFSLYPNNHFEIDYMWDQEFQDEINRLNKEKP
ncbi:MAG TPA: hypothetical protein VIK89_02495 [Cytophagaceae bacterium]